MGGDNVRDLFLNPPPGSAIERAKAHGVKLAETARRLELSPAERLEEADRTRSMLRKLDEDRCRMRAYRRPTELEREFLGVATRGYPLLEAQVEDCEIAEYDPTGWCYVRVLEGMPFYARPAQGPRLETGNAADPFYELLLWTNAMGLLEHIEIVEYGLGHSSTRPYELFVAAARGTGGRLTFKTNGP